MRRMLDLTLQTAVISLHVQEKLRRISKFRREYPQDSTRRCLSYSARLSEGDSRGHTVCVHKSLLNNWKHHPRQPHFAEGQEKPSTLRAEWQQVIR